MLQLSCLIRHPSFVVVPSPSIIVAHPTKPTSFPPTYPLSKELKLTNAFHGHPEHTPERLPVEDFIQTLRALPATSSSPRFQALIRKIKIDAGFHSINTFNSLLYALVTAGESQQALRLASNLPSYGLAPDGRTHSILVTCYCNLNDPFAARRVLIDRAGETGPSPDVATFTTLINAFCKNGRMKEAFEVLSVMDRVGCQPTITTHNCLLKGLCYVGRVEEAYDFFTNIKNSSASPDIYTYTALMNGFCKVGRSDEALELLDEALRVGLTPNAVAYNTLFNGFFKEGRPLEGVRWLKLMQDKGHCSPDLISYHTLLHGLLKWGEIPSALGIYREMVAIGFEADERLMNALLRGLCRRARREDALLKDVYDLYGRMRGAGCAIRHPAYDMMIEAFCRGKEVEKALLTLQEMIRLGNSPKSITFRSVVCALCRQGKVEHAWPDLLDLMNSDNTMSFDILIDEMKRNGVLFSAPNVYGAAIKRGAIRWRKLGVSASSIQELQSL